MTSRLNDKVAIVTGGGSGYGAGIATKFASEGAKVIIADISAVHGEKTAKELGCIFVKADVTSRKDWETLLQTAVDKYGGIDIVVNNAGASYQNKVSKSFYRECIPCCNLLGNGVANANVPPQADY